MNKDATQFQSCHDFGTKCYDKQQCNGCFGSSLGGEIMLVREIMLVIILTLGAILGSSLGSTLGATLADGV
jgi:hypothetical protein